MEWGCVGRTRNCCVVLNLNWRLSNEIDRRGNGTVAEREICHLLSSSWVCLCMIFSRHKLLQICGEEGNQNQSLAETGKARTWVQSEEEISRGKARPVVSEAHVSSHYPPASPTHFLFSCHPSLLPHIHIKTIMMEEIIILIAHLPVVWKASLSIHLSLQ